MGQKIQPHGFRLGVDRTWDSQWYAEGDDYKQNLKEDLQIRELIDQKMRHAGLAEVIIRRSEKKMDIEIFVARPGVAIGRGGSDIDKLKKEVEELTDATVNIRISEVGKPDLSSKVVAKAIAEGLERRVPSKILMNSYRQKVVEAGATGVKIIISGRIGGAIQARTIKTTYGQVPLHTLRAGIDYAEESAIVPNSCTFGIKVYIYKEDDSSSKRVNS